MTWRTPYGGLGLDFHPLLKSQHYELCFVAQSSLAALQLFLEENQTLTRLAALNGSKLSETREICLKSDGNKPIVIFIETDSGSSSPVYGRMILEYDIQVINQSYSTHLQGTGIWNCIVKIIFAMCSIADNNFFKLYCTIYHCLQGKLEILLEIT